MSSPFNETLDICVGPNELLCLSRAAQLIISSGAVPYLLTLQRPFPIILGFYFSISASIITFLLKIKHDINRRYLKIVNLNFVKSEYISLT